jgi:peptidyl-prolyl cis-trans isomerase C
MRATVRLVVMGLVVMGLAVGGARAQQAPPATKGATPPAATQPAAPPRPADLDKPVATVNGEAITKGNLIDFLSRYQIPPGDDEMVYRDAVQTLVNMRLIGQFLARQKIAVPQEKLDQAINDLDKQLKADGSSLAQALVESGKSLDDVRREYTDRLRWVDFVKARGTDAELKKFAASHKDLLNGTQVRASHILLRVDPKASAEEREKIRQRLLGIKNEVTSGKISFAEAANKYSEDPANSEKGGGDIGYFGLNSGIVEEFAKAAFAQKKGEVSDPVETPYGYHLIQVTDRKEGGAVDFEQQKPLIVNTFAADLQRDILTAERKTAKVDVKPMPPDLFPPAPAPEAPATGGAPATKDATKR